MNWALARKTHNVKTDLLHCFSGSTHQDANGHQDANCSVAQSFGNSLGTDTVKTIAGGGSVIGYTTEVSLRTGRHEIAAGVDQPVQLTPAEVFELRRYAFRMLAEQGRTIEFLDENSVIKTTWIIAHTPLTVNPVINEQDVIDGMRRLFDAAHPNHAAYNFRLAKCSGS